MRFLAENPAIDLHVACCTRPDPRLYRGEEYINKAVVPSLMSAGVAHTYVPNRAPVPSLGNFFGVINPRLVRMIRDGQWDACLIYGYAYASCWLAMIAARRAGVAVLLSTDATTLAPQHGGRWKGWLKRLLLPYIYQLADVIVVPSTDARLFVRTMGVSNDRVVLTPYVVDNAGIQAAAELANPVHTRAAWGIPGDAPVALFCGKFIARKRPQDAVRAFALAAVAEAHLLLVGAGPLEVELRAAVDAYGLKDRVHFCGLVAYEDLPAIYAAADVLVVSSSHEPWGLPVNEAMLCATAVIASDRVGAARDLITDGVTGYVYDHRKFEMLVTRLRECLADRSKLTALGEAAALRMQAWSPQHNAESVARAVRWAVARRLTLLRSTAARGSLE